MNIQARKLILIEEFLRISDVSTIEKLEYFIKIEKKYRHEKDLKPMSLKEFYEMIDHAILNKENDQTISHQDLKKKVKSWK